MRPFGPGTSTRAPGAIFWRIPPDATEPVALDAVAAPIAPVPMPRIAPRGSWGGGGGIGGGGMRIPPGDDALADGERTMSMPGWVDSSGDCTSIGGCGVLRVGGTAVVSTRARFPRGGTGGGVGGGVGAFDGGT